MKIEHLFSAVEDPWQGEENTAGSLLGHYVLHELPADLRAVSAGNLTYEELRRKQNLLLAEVAHAIADISDPHTARLTQLDLLLLVGGYLPGGPEVPRPDRLPAMIAAQRARFPDLDDHMSYELLIDVNCAEYVHRGDIRTYSDGEAARHERDFYLGHFLAEPSARSAAHRLRRVVDEPADAAEALTEAATDLAEFKLVMGRYGRLSRSAFTHFRQYLTSYSGGARGASGAFMPSVQLVELTLLRPTEQYNAYLDESMAYFPSWARPEITRARTDANDGRTLADLLESGRIDPDARAALRQVLDEFIDFRMIHLGVTRRHIPEAFRDRTGLTRAGLLAMGGERAILDGGTRGTSGFDVRNVLTNAVHRLLVLRERV